MILGLSIVVVKLLCKFGGEFVVWFKKFVKFFVLYKMSVKKYCVCEDVD